MTLRHKIDAALLSVEGLKFADTVVTPPPGQRMRVDAAEGSVPLASRAANAQPDPAEAAQNVQRILARVGGPQETLSPLTDLPQADPAIMSSVLERARVARDPMDYLRLFSHDKDVNELARMAAMPALLMSDALTSRDVEGAQTREAVIDALRNLQLPAMSPARAPAVPSFQGSIPLQSRAYPMWYPR